MKKNITLSLALILAGSMSAFAQSNVKALSIENNGRNSDVTLLEYSPQTGDVINEIGRVDLESNEVFRPNSMFYNESSNTILFQVDANHLQRFKVVDAESGNVLRSFNLNQAMAPVFIARGNSLGFVSSIKVFSGYNNNDDDNSFTVFNLDNGKMKGKIDLDQISFANVKAPFFGQAEEPTNFGKTKLVGVGSPLYVAKTDKVYLSAMDVMGAYRMFVLDIKNMVLERSFVMNSLVMHMDYDEKTGDLITYHVEKENDIYTTYIGRLNPESGSFVNQKEISKKSDQLADIGLVQFDKENDKIIFLHSASSTQNRYVLEATSLDILTGPEKPLRGSFANMEFNYSVNPEDVEVRTLDNSIRMYPNPNPGILFVYSDEMAKAQRIEIFNVNGQLVKDVLVQTSELEVSMNVEHLVTGVYTVHIHTPGATVVKKLVVQ